MAKTRKESKRKEFTDDGALLAAYCKAANAVAGQEPGTESWQEVGVIVPKGQKLGFHVSVVVERIEA